MHVNGWSCYSVMENKFHVVQFTNKKIATSESIYYNDNILFARKGSRFNKLFVITWRYMISESVHIVNKQYNNIYRYCLVDRMIRQLKCSKIPFELYALRFWSGDDFMDSDLSSFNFNLAISPKVDIHFDVWCRSCHNKDRLLEINKLTYE